MHNNIKNNDSFSNQVRQKLEGHQTPVEPAVWEAIEAKMAVVKARKRIPLGWWLTAGMAAAVALLLTLSPFTTQTETELAQTKKENNNVTPTEIASTKTVPNSVATVTKQTKKNTANFRTHSAQLNTKISTEKDTITASNTNNAILATYIEKPTNKIATETTEKPTIAQYSQPVEPTTDTAKTIVKPGTAEKLQLKQEEWKDPLNEKDKGGWELIAMVGGAGKTSQSSNAVLQTSTLRPRMSIVKAETVSAIIFSPEEFSNKTYMAPITAGFAISRKITKNLAIETGINYTYLLTNFKNNQVSANLNLHYMGIPARFTYKLTSGSKWNMYAGAGGMVEKGLWSVYVQKQNFNTQTITTTVTDKIDGFQWSVNAALGGEYTLAKSAAIYFEPRISYYFDNNQPLSTRTENKLVIGFEGGLRYKF